MRTNDNDDAIQVMSVGNAHDGTGNTIENVIEETNIDVSAIDIGRNSRC